MKQFSKSVEKHEQEQDVKLKQQYNATHHARKEDHHHNTTTGIAYSEYQCLKLGHYRSDDRPHGNEKYATWKNRATNATTFSKAEAKAWIKAGVEVWEYSSNETLKKVHNVSKATREMFKKNRVYVKFA